MRKTLLATTALAAATGMAAIASPASAAERLSLGVHGYFQAYYGYFDVDDNDTSGDDYRSHDFFREAEIHFRGEVALDNGMKVGVDVQLEAESCGDQIDESYLYFQGDFGKLVLGSENSAAYLMSYGAPAVDANFDGADPNYAWSPFADAFGESTFAYAPNMTSDSEKITYFTPRFAGFGFGISYTPENTEDAGSSAIPGRDNDGTAFGGRSQSNVQSDIVELGLNYENKFGDFGVLAGVTYGFANDTENGFTIAGVSEDEQEEWSAGLNLTFAGFTVGGGYWWNNGGLTDDGDYRAYTGGVAWANGPLRLAASYMNYQIESNNIFARSVATGVAVPSFAVDEPGDDLDMDRYVVGASYVYAPGMQVRSSVQYWDWQDDDLIAAFVGTVISF